MTKASAAADSAHQKIDQQPAPTTTGHHDHDQQDGSDDQEGIGQVPEQVPDAAQAAKQPRDVRVDASGSRRWPPQGRDDEEPDSEHDDIRGPSRTPRVRYRGEQSRTPGRWRAIRCPLVVRNGSTSGFRELVALLLHTPIKHQNGLL